MMFQNESEFPNDSDELIESGAEEEVKSQITLNQSRRPQCLRT